MAIPFFEPKNSENEQFADQVDGNSSHQPGHHPGMPSENSSTNPPTAMPHPVETGPTTEQVLAWKILAITMCKALNQYYLQKANSKDLLKDTVMEVHPSGDVQ